ncbi:MAG: FkbM family methyltransferase [Ginsengibacter sp.]
MLKKILLKLIKPLIGARSYSQAGEDRILAFLFDTMGIRNISYLDIGANHPEICNNTYLFYRRGSKGILIEPDPAFNTELQKARPGDKVVQAAISDNGTGEADFYIFNEPSINTLSKEEAIIRQQSGKYYIKETKKIQLLTVEKIIADHMNNTTPHLISLDVEGVDYDVLSAFDFVNYPVPVWVIETCEYSENHIKPKITSIIDLMQTRGYFIYADTYINTIFVNREWFDNYKNKS